MTAGARRVLAVVGGLVFGFALGAVSTSFVPGVDGNSAALGGLGIGLGVGMLVAALVRE
jgi:membrane associated rhomboid family serine protease